MVIKTHYLQLNSPGNGKALDLTDRINDTVLESGIVDGMVILFVPGSTAAITTIEYEPGVLSDLENAIERLAPLNIPYAHDQAWGDGNGHAHVRAAMIGPDLIVPVVNGRPTLGTWQQVVLIDFDNRPRKRKVICQVIGNVQ